MEAKSTDFYCEQHKCHMTYEACVRRQNLVQAKPAATSAHLPPAKNLIVGPELCIDCEQGKQNQQILAERKARKIKSAPATGPCSKCLWPGCEKEALASGLCQAHYKAAKKNTLVKLNTKNASPDALKTFLEQLVLIAEKNGMPVEDVGIACTNQGIQEYFRIHPEPQKGEKTCSARNATAR